MRKRQTMNQTVSVFTSETRVAVICASWHAHIVGQASQSLRAELARQGLPASQVDLLDVPGAFEIPLLAQRLARHGRHAAIVACGLVVDGGIYRHDFVASAVIDGLMRVQLDTGVPVLSCVLTPQAFHEHAEHQQFFARHFLTKGQEVARALVHTLAALRKAQALLATLATERPVTGERATD
jgi:6,7-dimethyl-8-ribityllumazine synthase